MPLTISEPQTTITIQEPDRVVIVEQVTDVVTVQQGPPGPKGDQGPPGETYTHIQGAPATDWSINHSLGKRPAGVMVYDTADTHYIGEVEYIDDDNLTVHLSAAIAGRAEVV
jgi:hypothetical protein